MSCIHNDVENIMMFIDKISSLKFDVIVFPGDFTDYTIPRGFTRIDIAKIILEEMRVLGKPIICVPGSWDKEIIDFLDKEKVSVHGKGIVINGVGFYGFGGARTPFNTPYEPNDSEISSGLEKSYKDVKDAKTKIQVTHMPPKGTKIDLIFSGAHVGSDAVREFIERKSPDAAISAHIHEAKGTDLIGKTKIINSGRLPEGYCGLVSVGNGESTVKIVSLL